MTKIFYGNQYVGSMVVDGKKPVVGAWRKFKYVMKKGIRVAVICTFLAGATTGVFTAGKASTDPITVLAHKEVIVEVKGKSPVMDRIAKCESGGKHFNDKGKVIYNYNTNGSIDVGKYQINTVHLPLAGTLGLDINKEKDNEEMAYYLYENKGTEPWYSSKSCWNK